MTSLLLALIVGFGAQAQNFQIGTYQSENVTKSLRMTPTNKMGYSHSGLYRLSEWIPLGEGASITVVRHFQKLGVKNAVIELAFAVDSASSDRINVGPYKGSFQTGFSNLVGALKAVDITVTFKPTLVLGDRQTVVTANPDDLVRFWGAYTKTISIFAKLAEKLGVDELVLGTNLSGPICRSPSEFQTMLDVVRYYYSGRVRIDESPNKLNQLLSCIGTRQSDVATFGIELNLNPQAELTNSTIQNLFQNKNFDNTKLVISKVSFNGLDQSEKLQSFINGISTSIPATMGVFDVNPDRMTANDTSENVIGKPSFEILRQWYLK